MFVPVHTIPIELTEVARLFDRYRAIGLAAAVVGMQAATAVQAVTAIVDRIHQNRYQPRSYLND